MGEVWLVVEEILWLLVLLLLLLVEARFVLLLLLSQEEFVVARAVAIGGAFDHVLLVRVFAFVFKVVFVYVEQIEGHVRVGRGYVL